MKSQLIATIFALFLLVEFSSGFGLLSGLGLYGNPMLGSAGCGCGCGLPPPMYGYPGMALSKMPAMGLGCPSSCCLGMKPCLLTKLFLLKKKLMEKKMCLKGCGCGCGFMPFCCGMM